MDKCHGDVVAPVAGAWPPGIDLYYIFCMISPYYRWMFEYR